MCYPDINANQHMTSNVMDAHDKPPYHGQDFVMVGNGNSLPISIVGNLKIPSNEVISPNVLIISSIKKNLLLVS